jgi:hypothetical protein
MRRRLKSNSSAAKPRRMASAWATASSSFVARTTTAGPMSRPFSSKTKSRYRFMAAQSKNAGLTSLKTPYPRNPIQAAARPATGQTRLKNEIDCATISRSEAKIRGGIATTCAFCIFTVVLPGLWGKRVRYRTLGLPASSNLYKKARPCGPALGPNRLGERPAQHEGEKNGAGHW